MAKEFFKNLPSQETPFNASRWNGLLNGEESMGSIVVEDVVCKNLFNKDTITAGYRLTTAGTYVDSNYFVSDFIEIEPNTTYTVNYEMSVYTRMLFYDADKNILKANETNATFTTPSNAKYIRIGQLLTELNNVQLEKGSIATDYTPYKKFGYNSTDSMGEIVVDDIRCKNIFDKNNATILSAYIDGGVIKSITTASTFYIKCEPNTTYTVSKKPGQRFSVGYMKDVPTIGATLSSYVRQDTSSSITIKTNDTANYIVVWYYSGSYDTITEAQMRSSVQVEKGSVATNYVEHKEFSNKQIYSTSEQVVGTWVDGSTLYKKTIDFGTLPNATSKKVAHNISDLRSIIKIETVATTGENFFPLPFLGTETNLNITFYANKTNILISAPIDRSSYSAYVTLYYVKSTTSTTSTASIEDETTE